MRLLSVILSAVAVSGQITFDTKRDENAHPINDNVRPSGRPIKYKPFADDPFRNINAFVPSDYDYMLYVLRTYGRGHELRRELHVEAADVPRSGDLSVLSEQALDDLLETLDDLAASASAYASDAWRRLGQKTKDAWDSTQKNADRRFADFADAVAAGAEDLRRAAAAATGASSKGLRGSEGRPAHAAAMAAPEVEEVKALWDQATARIHNWLVALGDAAAQPPGALAQLGGDTEVRQWALNVASALREELAARQGRRDATRHASPAPAGGASDADAEAVLQNSVNRSRSTQKWKGDEAAARAQRIFDLVGAPAGEAAPVVAVRTSELGAFGFDFMTEVPPLL